FARARAKDMLYSGRLVGAEEALRIGLADRVFPAESLMEEALSYLSGVTTLSSNSHRIAKQVVGAILDGVDSETDDLRTLFDSAYVSDDFREGYRAFLEKRKPVFK
ncbi:MAG: enoyl-CoA hydratase-related protein, partial [Paracoccaceae bacterium]|nr:enoyl-CoA hydratase-related protein [Paracoccaceae bacterium]